MSPYFPPATPSGPSTATTRRDDRVTHRFATDQGGAKCPPMRHALCRPTAPAGLLGAYDARLNVYNFKASNTRPTCARRSAKRRRARGARSTSSSGTRRPTSCVGGTTYDRPNMWPFIYRSTLATLGIPRAALDTSGSGGSGTAPNTPA